MNTTATINKDNIEIFKGKLTLTFAVKKLKDFTKSDRIEKLESLMIFYREEAKIHPMATKLIFKSDLILKEFSDKISKMFDNALIDFKNYKDFSFSFGFYNHNENIVMICSLTNKSGTTVFGDVLQFINE